MKDQKESLMSAERAIKRLAKLARRVSDENMANWMIEGDKLGECRAADIGYVAEWLTGVSHVGKINQFDAAKAPKCIVCGDFARDRSHSKYCTSRCRQKAYRQRNGLNAASRAEA
jgi:hypothetical protein